MDEVRHTRLLLKRRRLDGNCRDCIVEFKVCALHTTTTVNKFSKRYASSRLALPRRPQDKYG